MKHGPVFTPSGRLFPSLVSEYSLGNVLGGDMVVMRRVYEGGLIAWKCVISATVRPEIAWDLDMETARNLEALYQEEQLHG